MRAADQWAQIEATLDPDWSEAQASFTPEGSTAEAAAILGPLQPGHVGDHLRLHITRSDGGAERARNLFTRLDRRRIWGTLSLVGVIGDVAPAAAARPPAAPTQALADAWDDALSALPPGWSDLLCELELDSSDHVPRAALLGAPLNPTRVVECDRSPLPRLGEAGLRRLAADGASLLRAHGRRGDHGPDHGSPGAFRHGERRHAGPRLAPCRPVRLAAPPPF